MEVRVLVKVIVRGLNGNAQVISPEAIFLVIHFSLFTFHLMLP
jgi:hypothetical protein